MNLAQTELADAFPEIRDAIGVPVTVDGNSITGVVFRNEIDIEHDQGGFTRSAEVSVKCLVADLPTPLPGLKVPVVIDSETYAVTGIDRKPDSPTVRYFVTPS